MDMQKIPDGRFMISFNDRDDERDIDSYMAHSNFSLTLFLTPEQLEELQSLSVPEEPTEQEKEDERLHQEGLVQDMSLQVKG